VGDAPMHAPAPAAPAPAGADDRVLILSEEARARAVIQTAVVTARTSASQTRWPGVVEPDAYRSVDITPIVGGTVVEMRAALGDVVRRGSVVGRLRSPDLTDAVRRWLTMRADSEVAARRLTRTRGLAKIGAASQQDLEEEEAAALRASTELDTARIRLSRLGIAENALGAIAAGGALPETVDVVAQAAGVVVRREVNVGQNIEAATPMVSLADPSRVWVLADVFERDLSALRVGQQVTVTSESFAGRSWKGTIAYIDPQVARETRSVRARIELDNPGGVLRFGMLVSVLADGPADAGLTVPRTAVQTIGAASVVYVEEPAAPGRYLERSVVSGPAEGDAVVILAGLEAGERVVTSGSFLLRAERDRLGWPAPVPHPPVDPAVGTVTAPRGRSAR
jgi:cobalt-zinc-cadmium efflux system membrane fusion protein